MGCRITFAADYQREEVAGQWQMLEKRAPRSFFLSWTWISCWLDSLAAPPLLLRAWKENNLAAMGFFSRATRRRGILPRRRQLHLHQSGDLDLDRIAVEFNGLLVGEEDEAQIVPQAMAHLAELAWDECILPGVSPSYCRYAEQAGYACTVERDNPDFLVDLEAVRARGTDWTDSLSANRRHQLRRALRLAAGADHLRLRPAADLREALEWFEELIELDRARRGPSGAFASPVRIRFHRHLIERGFARGEVELLRAGAGGHAIGILYQFRHGGRVSLYQAGTYPGPDNRHRPGLVMHYLSIMRAIAQGDRVYDFLAGEARYKRSLGEAGDALLWLRLQRPSPMVTFERGARCLKDALFQRTPRQPAI